MSEWTLVKVLSTSLSEGFGDMLTGGFSGSQRGYIYEHDDTGKRVLVMAISQEAAGEKLSEGDYVDMDDD